MQWKVIPIPEKSKIEQLQKTLGVPSMVAQILLQRGIESFDKAKIFFRPEWSHLHDPFLMEDMKVATDRILSAIAQNEKVMIFGDYDVDGTTSVALVYSFLKNKIQILHPYIPDRYKEGYGISKIGIDVANQNGISLIIALDCGIKAMEEVTYAKSLGIDFIICDHHQPDDELPEAIAILDPKRKDCNYPYKELCGCGIGFKLIQALQIIIGSPESELASYTDLVATAIAADIVPISGENRTLTFLGIKQLKNFPRIGFQFFLKSLKNSITVTDLIFVIAPRINAAGRMDHGLNAVRLLISTELEEALSISRSIEFFNTERKSTDERITKEAIQQIELNQEQEKSSTVVFHPSWHKGVIGIVASRLIEQYYRPTVVLTKSDELLSGSVRSVSGFDVYQALHACKDFMIQFGGHKYAAGLTLGLDQFKGFKAAFDAYVVKNIKPDQLKPTLFYDSLIDFAELNEKLLRILNQMAPFGPKNMRPTFVTMGCKDKGGTRLVGQDKNHLKLELIDCNGDTIHGIGFGLGSHLLKIKEQISFSVLYTLDENDFNGIKSLQIKVKDLKFEE